MEHNLIRREEQQRKKSLFWTVFLILGLLTLAFAITFNVIITQKAEERTPTREIHHFVGIVGNSVHMSIIIDGAKVTGKYYYDAIEKPMKLCGEKIGDKLTFTDSYAGKTAGRFDGELVSGEFKGTYTRVNGVKYDFILMEKEGGPKFFTENEIEY